MKKEFSTRLQGLTNNAFIFYNFERGHI